MIYDVIIIGAGPGGISAAVYAKRSGLSVLIIEKGLPGGLMNYTNIVENYPGFTSINGPNLAENFKQQLDSLEVTHLCDEVIKIEEGNIKKVFTKKSEYQAKKVIIAIGRSPKKLGLPNEDKLFGYGISYCSLCDAMLYRNKNVAVYGGGNSAFEEGIYLAKFAKNVIVLNRGLSLRADNILQKKIKEYPNIHVINECKVTKLNGEDRLESIEVNGDEILDVDGLFVYIGYRPDTKFLENLNICDDLGYILVDKNYETNIKGIFAIGDVTKKSVYQIVTAVAEGATAAINAYTELNNN